MSFRGRRLIQQRQQSACNISNSNSSSVLDAAALQDGLARRMELKLGGQRQARSGVVVIVGGGSIGETPSAGRRRSTRFSTKQPGRQNTTVQEAATTIGSGNKSSTTKATTNSAEASSWTRRSCSAINSVADAGNDSVDSNKSAPCSPCLTESFLPGYEEGRRQPRRRVCVTLGQLRGLEEPPQPTLTAGEWSEIEARAWARGDEVALCPICREAFRGESQVILSCSHVFHKACLSSFERFLRGQERSCPLCRKTGYKKKLTSQGAVAWRQRCARTLQCAYRGYKARRAYHVLLRSHYAAGFGDPQRRRVFLSDQAADKAGRLVTALEHRRDSIDRLFGEFDRSLALSRSVFGQTPLASLNDNYGGNILATLHSLPENEPSGHQSQASSPKGPQIKDHNWNEVWRKAIDRGEEDCPICMCQMEPVHFAAEAYLRGGSMLVRELGDDGAPSHEKEHAAEYMPVHTDDSCAHLCWSSFNSRDVSTGQEGDRKKQMLGESRDGQGSNKWASMGAKCRLQRPACAKAILLLSCSHAFHKTAFEGFKISEEPLCPVCRQEYDAIDPSGASFTTSSS